MIRCWLTPIGVIASLWPGLAQADPLAICRAGNPQFPQLCECAIARAQAEGIEGTVLDRLLANRWDGVPMDVANRYGLIFMECTQAAVAGGAVWQTPAPQAPLSAPPAQAPAPAATAPATPALPRFELAPPREAAGTDAARVPLTAPPMQMPALTETAPSAATPGATPPDIPISALASIPGGYQIVSDAAPDVWTLGSWRRGGNGSLVPTVRNAAGLALAFRCGNGPAPMMIVGPFPDGVPGQDVQITVRGAQGVIHQEANRALGFDRSYLAIGAMNQALISALRSGNGVDLAFSQSGGFSFGLRGSARALDGARCGAIRAPGWLYAMAWDEVRHDPWTVGQALHPNGIAPGLFIPAVQGVAPDLLLTCDRRLASQSSLSGYDGRLTGQITLWRDGVETAQFPIATEVQGFRAQTDPLSDEIIAAMLSADRLSYLVDLDAEPGGFVGIETTLAGVAEGLPALVCPAAPGSVLPDGARDLTGAADWRAVVTADGLWSTSFAAFEAPGAPRLFVSCAGRFSILEDVPPRGRQSNQVRARLVVDNDLSRSVAPEFIYVRGGPAEMLDAVPQLGQWLLAGRTLRLTMEDDPGNVYVYPLAGLAEAIASLPRPCAD